MAVKETKFYINPLETIDFNIRAAWLGISRMYTIFGQEHGLTMSVSMILLGIDKENGINTTKLGPLVGMQANSLSRAIKMMEEQELIYKKKGEKDKREVRLYLTKKGMKKRDISYLALSYFNKKLQEVVPKSKINDLIETTSKIINLTDDLIESEVYKKEYLSKIIDLNE